MTVDGSPRVNALHSSSSSTWPEMSNKSNPFSLLPHVVSDLYFSHNIVRVINSRRMRWAGHVACVGEERGAYRVLVGKPEGKRPLGRHRSRWVNNIRMDLQELGFGYWTGLG